MVIETKFEIGDFVYLRTDPNQNERLVTAITVTPDGLLYILARGQDETKHYAMEISTEKNIIISSQD